MELMFDTHAHYYDDWFCADVEAKRQLLANLFAGEVCGIVNVGTSPENSRTVVAEAARWEGMYATVGIHPGDGQRIADVDGALREIEEMICDKAAREENKIVALGEIGLDYHYEGTDKALQAYIFDAQMRMAQKYKLPVVIHDREAHGDTFDTVCCYPDVEGVFHSYSGSAEMARDLVRRGWYISFSGTVTFKNAPRVREAAAAVPLDRILIETDAPYLAPVPYRGRQNHSGLMRHTAAAIAEVKGVSLDEIVRATRENALRFFKIS